MKKYILMITALLAILSFWKITLTNAVFNAQATVAGNKVTVGYWCDPKTTSTPEATTTPEATPTETATPTPTEEPTATPTETPTPTPEEVASPAPTPNP